ncbi:hypothetical protein SDRG_06097 [Saprolegnia diclina VS20]|uniref:Uncharacterized protein n=1 Tax=Saprolegnia diclina (strain VS20) TaxID=1156394 RepID=T0QPJ0_SAPDV|nr:hypothetical protein SDRG_06097 [Saprolegnia diclina VS20]EQC36661.1 hypothetical protein SDRG_06097 [Saprolegnia diclina VS20]|eukprot:XP_008610082.1 hypothetical protein SDRG_06097 [Saprolegnia diclina VS20]
MRSTQGLRGARELAKAKLYATSSRPEWNNEQQDLSQLQCSDKELALKHEQRTSKHLETAKADLYFKAQADQLAARERALLRDQEETRNQQSNVLSQQVKLNKLYEVVEKRNHEVAQREAKLDALEKALRDREVFLAQCQAALQAKEAQVAQPPAQPPPGSCDESDSRELALQHRAQELALWGERLVLQEKQLATMETLFETRQQEWEDSRRRLQAQHADAVTTWQLETQATTVRLAEAREKELRQYQDNMSKLALEQGRLRDQEAVLRAIKEATSTMTNEHKTRDAELAARATAVAEREAEVAARATELDARALELETRDNVRVEKEKWLRNRERKLDVLAQDVETQHELNVQKTIELAQAAARHPPLNSTTMSVAVAHTNVTEDIPIALPLAQKPKEGGRALRRSHSTSVRHSSVDPPKNNYCKPNN